MMVQRRLGNAKLIGKFLYRVALCHQHLKNTPPPLVSESFIEPHQAYRPHIAVLSYILIGNGVAENLHVLVLAKYIPGAYNIGRNEQHFAKSRLWNILKAVGGSLDESLRSHCRFQSSLSLKIAFQDSCDPRLKVAKDAFIPGLKDG